MHSTAMIALARLTQPDFRSRARLSQTAELLTIPYSHYCEMASWSLQLGNKKFVERGYMPGEHVLPLLSLRVAGSQKFLSSSSFVTKAGGKECANQSEKAQESKRSAAVPALCLPDGTVLKDSWEISEYSGLLKVSPEYKDMYDIDLGPATRQFAYAFMLKPSARSEWDSMLTSGGSWLWRIAYWFVGNKLWRIMRALFGVSDSEIQIRNEQKLHDLFDRIHKTRLANVKGYGTSHDSGTTYINGDEITVEDIVLCSLCGPVVLPDLYCEGRFYGPFNAVLSQDSALRCKVDKFRRHPVGQYVLKFYAQHRAINTEK